MENISGLMYGLSALDAHLPYLLGVSVLRPLCVRFACEDTDSTQRKTIRPIFMLRALRPVWVQYKTHVPRAYIVLLGKFYDAD